MIDEPAGAVQQAGAWESHSTVVPAVSTTRTRFIRRGLFRRWL